MKLKKVIAVLSIMAMAFIVTGCGDSGSSGIPAGEDFTLGDNTFTLEKCVKITDNDTQSSEGYGVAVLIEGNQAPIVMSVNGGTPSSAVSMVLVKDDGSTISPSGINFDGIDDQGKYGVRMTFNFDVPVGEGLPATATMTNTNNEEESVTLDLSSAPTE